MIRPPFAARVALGIAVTVVEEARRLPTTAFSLPMTAVSEVLQTAMRFQQTVTELAIKGDQVFSLLGGRPEEQPEWATFDDDAARQFDDDAARPSDAGPARPSDAGPTPGRYTDVAVDAPSRTATGSASSATDTSDGDAPTSGRFALYSTPPSEVQPADHVAAPTLTAADARPEIAEYLDYDALTLAQLRARLRSLSVDDLTELLDYETAAKNRAPYRTMLENRITTARAK
ncbi:lipid droplet-associated protein [Rhodococcus kroppenstedtii]|uniref:lipid droplet-associated protein n=1 Tax=Rhodococcoides kroppenstedtii TaxID=293050 RepID=UPI001C9B3022|nr:lipid droplet-associated protein [Rhodococcus kroppenstedtii]MBY6435960.1 lipid droplet-associated protein [Rhodococcus kroppenstedtii]